MTQLVTPDEDPVQVDCSDPFTADELARCANLLNNLDVIIDAEGPIVVASTDLAGLTLDAPRPIPPPRGPDA